MVHPRVRGKTVVHPRQATGPSMAMTSLVAADVVDEAAEALETAAAPQATKYLKSLHCFLESYAGRFLFRPVASYILCVFMRASYLTST